MAGDLCAKAPVRQGCAPESALRVSGMAGQAKVPGGVVHGLPSDFEATLKGQPEALATWLDITPLARNEWICWIESAKKAETRLKRIDWGCESLTEGKRR